LELVGHLEVPDGSLQAVTISNDMAYLADWNIGLFVVDCSDLQNPRIISNLMVTGNAEGVIVEGDSAFLTDRNFVTEC